MPGEYETFEGIYLDLSRTPGKCRFAATGMGWKASARGGASKDQSAEVWTLPANEFMQAQWSRASKGYELKVFTRTMGVVQLDGFEQDDIDRVRDTLKGYYNIPLEHREHALKGWNWGKAEFTKYELLFNVANKPAFEIPYNEVSNLNLAGRAEVAVEFASGEGNQKKKNKATAGVDQLVEMRLYIPGTAKKDENEDGESEQDGEKGEEMHAANLFYDTLKEKAEIGEVAGVTYATFLDILFLTPRGRYDIDMYENSFRIRGKTYVYKIQYDHAKRFFLLPKPDDVHMLAVIGLEPPLRQGQTRYPFLVMQFKKEEDMEFDLNISEEVLKTKYQDRLSMHYEAPAHQVVTNIFKGLTGKKIIAPSRDFSSHHGQSGVKCSNKANEGHLFFLDKAFLFVPKPAVYMSFDKIQHVTMSRVGGSVSASRTFDVTVKMTDGVEYQFNNINREEQQPLESFLKIKNLRIKNDLVEETSGILDALDDEMDEDEDDAVGARADRGSADEDEESVDEDFQAESESDIAEEYDSAHESSGSSEGSEEEDEGDDEDLDGEVEDVPIPPKKKKEIVADGPQRKKVKTK